MTTLSLTGFILTSSLFTISPGPDNLFILAQGLANGRKSAIVTGMGMCSGVIVHTLAVSLGLAAVFTTSALAFDVIKYAGAAYLLFLAWQTLRKQTPLAAENKTQNASGQRSTAKTFRRGFLMNVLNPKVMLFFLAFLPQFTDSQSTVPFELQIIFLGAVFMAQATVCFAVIGFFAGSIGNWLQTKPGASKYFRSGTAVIFAALALRLIVLRR